METRTSMIVQYRHTLPLLLKELGLPLIGVEAGVAEAYNARDLLANGMEKMYLVDIWESHPERFGDIGMDKNWHDRNYQDAMARLEPFIDKIEILRGFTVDMAYKIPDESLGLVYIDADHSKQGVLNDLTAYYPKLVKGGVMAGHDFLAPQFGVKAAVEEFVNGRTEIFTIPENGDPNNASFWFKKW